MREFILFIDTETTGIPLDWEAPYSDNESWPYSVQIAWSVYNRQGQELKSENHYIYEPELVISEASERIHGITKDFLLERGEPRRNVLLLLTQDLKQYKPLVVGHFMQLDYHMLGVGFHRADLPNPLPGLPNFCTMKASASFLLHQQQNFLRLGELYERLFHKPLERQHDAIVDAKATAACFFKLLEQGDITEDTIRQQQAARQEIVKAPEPRKNSILLLLLAIVILAVLLILLI
ncbi:DNA polymerase-3 subunit epsilon [Pontibacter mucosus]|uniref:DNA polymerase-3 subunit epsilon n=1 Tax=Pontibacter mucosus TaxID=1649266 RepID=A0A2T5YQ04_9BACT|nr:3'-5' exonuclease [Pontibacter mucosus]PTX21395.1 DNA polymerase-3 subunit epsilon [Pontibacter mucosus]